MAIERNYRGMRYHCRHVPCICDILSGTYDRQPSSTIIYWEISDKLSVQFGPFIRWRQFLAEFLAKGGIINGANGFRYRWHAMHVELILENTCVSF